MATYAELARSLYPNFPLDILNLFANFIKQEFPEII